jgi:hypothetical protein
LFHTLRIIFVTLEILRGSYLQESINNDPKVPLKTLRCLGPEPGTCECYLTWQKGLCDVIKNLEVGRLSKHIRLEPKCNHRCPHGTEVDREEVEVTVGGEAGRGYESRLHRPPSTRKGKE